MNQVKIAALKDGLSKYLALVREGTEIVVVDRDTPIARIVPFRPRREDDAGAAGAADDYWTAARLASLEGRGTVRRPRSGTLTGWLRTRKPVKLPAGTPGALKTLLEMRRGTTR